MKQIDIIMLTNTANNDIYRMTLDAVISLRKSYKEDLFNIILVESNKDTTYEFPVDLYLKPEQSFNYNVYLNEAIKINRISKFINKNPKIGIWSVETVFGHL